MESTQPIPPYCAKELRKECKKDVAELYRLDKKLKSAKQKKRKLKKQCTAQKMHRKQAEEALAQERSDAVRREFNIRLQTKLDDLSFYQAHSGEVDDL